MNIFNCCLRRENTAEPKQNILKSCHGYGSSKMGYGVNKSECYDVPYIMESLTAFAPNYRIFAIYDGHGSFGPELSRGTSFTMECFLGNNYLQFTQAKNDHKRKEFLIQAFRDAEKWHKEMVFSNSGVCVTNILFLDSTLFVANLGNSAAGLFRKKGNDKFFIPLSANHNMANEQEKTRILKQGGIIKKKEGDVLVNRECFWANEEGPGVSFTRSFGDHSYKKFLISEPEINQYELTKDDQFIILASDSVWNVITLQEACEFVEKQEQKEQSAELFVQECRRRWDEINGIQTIDDTTQMTGSCDDITVVIVYLYYYEDNDKKIE